MGERSISQANRRERFGTFLAGLMNDSRGSQSARVAAIKSSAVWTAGNVATSWEND